MGTYSRASRIILAGVVVIATVVAPAAFSADKPLPAGCDTSRTAVAYYSDGTAPTKPDTVIPCAVSTGYGGGESQMEVAPNGDLVVTPAMTTQPGFGYLPPDITGVTPPDGAPDTDRQDALANAHGLSYSPDRGQTWSFVKPAGRRFVCCDQGLYIDPVTGRLFFSSINGNSSGNVASGSDVVGETPMPPYQLDGLGAVPLEFSSLMSTKQPNSSNAADWNGPTNLPGVVAENGRFTSAGPVVNGERMSYWCGDGPVQPETRLCYRTSDGGKTWVFASVFNYGSGSVPNNPCPQAQGIGGVGPYPHGAPDGSLYAACGTNLIQSTDQAATWSVIKTLPTSISTDALRIDSAGNLYLLSTSTAAATKNHSMLWTSRNNGTSWSGPFDTTPPDLRAALTSGARKNASGFQTPLSVDYASGDATIAFFLGGHPNDAGVAQSGWNDGYIVVTHNTLDPNPVFYAAMVNPPSRPLFSGAFGLGSANDFIDNAIGPDGTPYAAFFSDCLKDAEGIYSDSSCRDAKGTMYVQVVQSSRPAEELTVGSLHWVPPFSVTLTSDPAGGSTGDLSNGPVTVTFTATTANGDGTPVQYTIAFGDGETSTATMTETSRGVATATHEYRYAGTYHPFVTATQDYGSTAVRSGINEDVITLQSSVTVIHAAAARLIYTLPNGNVAPVDVDFDTAGSGGTSYSLEFGDGEMQAADGNPPAQVVHRYQAAGSYLATLSVSDGTNTATQSQTVTIVAEQQLTAELDLSTSGGNSPLDVVLDGCHSVPANGTKILSYTMDFDDGSATQTQTVDQSHVVNCSATNRSRDPSLFTHTYEVTATKTFHPTLTVSDDATPTHTATAKSLGGVAVNAPAAPAVSGGGGGGAFALLTVLPLLGAGLLRRRRYCEDCVR